MEKRHLCEGGRLCADVGPPLVTQGRGHGDEVPKNYAEHHAANA